jgi:hypothetical protein
VLQQSGCAVAGQISLTLLEKMQVQINTKKKRKKHSQNHKKRKPQLGYCSLSKLRIDFLYSV